ncbi:hypothetical protein MMC14_002984 [Varicellaria rhodocarpa]|nr:hypothetical protein [Varicellaria rhodocarpa]
MENRVIEEGEVEVLNECMNKMDIATCDSRRIENEENAMHNEWDSSCPLKYERIKRQLEDSEPKGKERYDERRARLAVELEHERDHWAEFMQHIQARVDYATCNLNHGETMDQIDSDFWRQVHHVDEKLDRIDFELDRLNKCNKRGGSDDYKPTNADDKSGHDQNVQRYNNDPLGDVENMLSGFKLQTESEAEDEWMYASRVANPVHAEHQPIPADWQNSDQREEIRQDLEDCKINLLIFQANFKHDTNYVSEAAKLCREAEAQQFQQTLEGLDSLLVRYDSFGSIDDISVAVNRVWELGGNAVKEASNGTGLGDLRGLLERVKLEDDDGDLNMG